MNTIASLLIAANIAVTIPPVLYEDANLFEAYTSSGASVGGKYSPEEKTIMIFQNHRYILLHELGHHVCHKMDSISLFGKGKKMEDFFSNEYVFPSENRDSEGCADTFRNYATFDCDDGLMDFSPIAYAKCVKMKNFVENFR